jgi:uncharacterized protein YjbI with pentapeptide repeats
MSNAESPREMLERAAKFQSKLDTVNIEGVDLSGAKLSRLQANFLTASDANLAGASFYQAGLFDCDFVRADCTHACFQSANFFQTAFKHTHGERVDFRKLRAEISWFDDAQLPRANFHGAVLKHSRFIRARMELAEFDEAQGEALAFVDATFTNASFRGAKFPGAVFSGANLQGTDFSLADLSGADFRGAHLEGAIFLGAKLEGALFDGRSPLTEPAPPCANVSECVREYLKKGDGAAALALYRAYQPQRGKSWIVNTMSRTEGDEELDPQAVAMLLREVLASSDDLLLLHEASCAAADLAQWGLKLNIENELSALLGVGTSVREATGGTARLAVNPGMQAALALGYLGKLDSLRAGLSAKGSVPERCAAGLIVAWTFDARTAETDALLANDKRSVMSGVVAGLGDRIRSSGWRAKSGQAVWGDPDIAVGIMKELTKHPDARQAKAAQVKLRAEVNMIEWLERRKPPRSP